MLLNEIMEPRTIEPESDLPCADTIAQALGAKDYRAVLTKVGEDMDPYSNFVMYCDHMCDKFKRLSGQASESAQGTRFLDRQDNHTVYKFSFTRPGDGYMKFIKDIRQPKYQNNPYFPKIYGYIFCGNVFFVEMEKLVPLHAESLQSVLWHMLDRIGVDPRKYLMTNINLRRVERVKSALWRKIVDPALQSRDKQAYEKAVKRWRQELGPRLAQQGLLTPGVDLEPSEETPGGIYADSSSTIQHFFSEEDGLEKLLIANDPQLRQRVRYLKKLRLWKQTVKQTRWADLDLHGDNWMIRLSKYGPQLVILDPIYSPGPFKK